MVFHYLADEINRFQKAYLKLTFILSLWVVVGCYLTIDERINITIYLPIFMRHEVRICLAKCKIDCFLRISGRKWNTDTAQRIEHEIENRSRIEKKIGLQRMEGGSRWPLPGHSKRQGVERVSFPYHHNFDIIF